MQEIGIRDINNNDKGKISLSEKIFENSASDSVVHTVVKGYLANQRQGTHATKTKGLVSGGGKKPWKQKHTGRARAGSNRSPLMRGGGTIFGPQPRDYGVTIPAKMKKVALFRALTMKHADGEIMAVDALPFEKPKTKEMVAILKNLGMSGKSVLIVLSQKSEPVLLSGRNIPGTEVIVVSDLSAYHVAAFDFILFTVDALRKLQGDEEEAA